MKEGPPATVSDITKLDTRDGTIVPAKLPKNPWSTAAFDAQYARHQQRTRNRRKRRLNTVNQVQQVQSRLAKLTPDLRYYIQALIAQAQARRAANHDRLSHGFRWPGGSVNGKAFLPFTSRRLRSDLHPILRLFVARLPRAGRGLRSGTDKTAPWGHHGKLVQLDQPYVTFSPAMRGTIRIDLDRNFPSWAALGQAILAAGLPLPSFAVGHVVADGGVEHPHAYWLLAEAVCWTDNGRLRPQRLLRAIERGMIAALDTAGADPGGLHNPLSGKNPLSELWTCQIMAAAPFNLCNGPKATLGLIALADHVRPVFGQAKHAAPAADGVDVADLLRQSNGLFHVLRRHVFATVAQYHPQGLGQGAGGQGAFVDAVLAYARSLGPLCKFGETTLERRARRAAEVAWSRFDGRPGRAPNRGRCQAACQGKSLSERQRIGALDVAARKRDATINRLVAAHQRLVAQGSVPADVLPANAVLAAEAGVAVRTLQKHRAAMLTLLTGDERRCSDKKLTYLSPTNPTPGSFFPAFSVQAPPLASHWEKPDMPADHTGSPIVPEPGPVQLLLTIASPALPVPPSAGFPPAGPPRHPQFMAATWTISGTTDHPTPAPSGMADELIRIGFVPNPIGTLEQLVKTAGMSGTQPATHQAVADRPSPASPLPSAPTNRPARAQRQFAPGFLAGEAQGAKQHATRPAVAPKPPPDTGRRLYPWVLSALARRRSS